MARKSKLLEKIGENMKKFIIDNSEEIGMPILNEIKIMTMDVTNYR